MRNCRFKEGSECINGRSNATAADGVTLDGGSKRSAVSEQAERPLERSPRAETQRHRERC